MLPSRLRGRVALLLTATLLLAGCTEPGGTDAGTGDGMGSGDGDGGASASPPVTPPTTTPPSPPTTPTTPPVPPTPPSNVTAVSWMEHAYLGTILADRDGRTLYVFTRDGTGTPTCEGACAANWPPALAAEHVAGPGNLTDRLGSAARADGSMQLTIDGRPLYRYSGDTRAGEALGQGRNDAWFVVREREAPGQRNVDFLDGIGAHEVNATNVTYGAGATGLLARPASGSGFPGVVMVHEWWGLNEHIRTMARALASHGYAVLAVDLFDGTVASEADRARELVDALDQEAALANLRAAVAHLRDEAGAGEVAALGWCFGGGQVMQLTVSGEPLDATVIYYGTLVTDEDRLAGVTWPVLGIFGGEDTAVPVEQVQAFQRALVNLSIPHEVQVYPGQGHAFANPSGDAYAPEAAMDAWAKTLAFLEARLGGGA